MLNCVFILCVNNEALKQDSFSHYGLSSISAILLFFMLFTNNFLEKLISLIISMLWSVVFSLVKRVKNRVYCCF